MSNKKKEIYAGETVDDVGLTRRQEMSRVMCCVLDKVSSEMGERFKQLMNFNDKFSFLLDTKSLLASRNDHDQLKRMCGGLWFAQLNTQMIYPAST